MSVTMDPIRPAIEPLHTEPDVRPSKPSIPQRTADFVRAHWKAIGAVALGVLAFRSKRLRPYAKTAATAYLLPMARQAFARVRA